MPKFESVMVLNFKFSGGGSTDKQVKHTVRSRSVKQLVPESFQHFSLSFSVFYKSHYAVG